MKKTLLIILISFFGLQVYAQETIKWMRFDEAIKACEKSPKKIFIDVYTDWCGWCKRMDQSTFSHPVIAKYMNEHFYAVKFDAECNDTIEFKGHRFLGTSRHDGKKGSHQLAYALLQGRMSYPSYVIMNEEKQVLQVINGFQPVKNFELILHFFAEEAYKNPNGDVFLKTFKSEITE